MSSASSSRRNSTSGAVSCARPASRPNEPAPTNDRQESKSMSYDLVIRNGTIVDGSGGPRYRGDVGVVGDRIAAIGRIRERGAQEIDAQGQIVAPGFIEVHSHMDAQIFWDHLGTSPIWHGITTTIMGNCGFTLAPCR